jgi:hypothetical protein
VCRYSLVLAVGQEHEPHPNPARARPAHQQQSRDRDGLDDDSFDGRLERHGHGVGEDVVREEPSLHERVPVSTGRGSPRATFRGGGSPLALPANTLPVTFPALPVLDVEKVLSRLPAETRARVAWAKKPIEIGLARLRTEPLTDDLVAQVADETWKPVASLGRAAWEIVGSNLDEWRARFVDDFKQEEQQLAEFLADEDSRDTLRWVLGMLQSFLGLALSVPPEFMVQIDETLFARLGADEDFKPYIRTLVLLMAVAGTRKAGAEPQRARDLLDVAFLELHKFRATLRRVGVSLTPFPTETVEERRRGLLESADRLRRTLSDEDWRVMAQARMHDLR